jgi:hypothetical protein
MTDNFNAYKQFITEKWSYSDLPEGDSYFVVELIRRGKDNPDMPAANYHFKNYYIRKPKDLDKYKQEIIHLCCMFRMRAYASVNIKSFKQVSLDTMAELTRRIANNDYRKNYAVFESCSGQYCHSNDKQWVVDLDDCVLHDEYPETIKDLINSCKPDGNKIVTEFPTKSGIHIITAPFNRKQFTELCKKYHINGNIDIKKNHLTLLYENL